MTAALEIARDVVAQEADALRQVAGSLGDEFAGVIELLLVPHAQVIVSGLGKSGHIAQKIAGSLTSTGTPALYMHPVEALHGDLGIVNDRCVLIALSRSGNTDELLRFATHFRRLGGPVVAITQGRESKLAEVAAHTLRLPDVPEAGPHGLAPTTSCVMMLAVGDALTAALLHARGFTPEDFARYHPEGALGRRLLLRAEDLMHGGAELPRVAAGDTFDHLIMTMTRGRLGLALVLERDGTLLGPFTDGDLRRIFERVANPRELDARAAFQGSRRAPDAPHVPASTVAPQALAVECLQLMRDGQITSLIVADDAGKPVGILRLMDLLNAGLA